MPSDHSAMQEEHLPDTTGLRERGPDTAGPQHGRLQHRQYRHHRERSKPG